MLIFLLERYMKNFLIKLLNEDFKMFGGLILGKIFIQSIIQKKINFFILIKQKHYLLKKLNKIKEFSLMKKY